MEPEKEVKKKKVLIVVAHPDDETIWMGGTILQHKDDWDPTIISLCRKNDIDRAPKFKQVCEAYGAKCFMSDLNDSERGYFEEITSTEIISRIVQFAEKEYDYIFTHGENGEYGHPRHIQVRNAVIEMLLKGLLYSKEISFFAYIKDGLFCDIDQRADKFINLDSAVYLLKKDLIKNIYGFQNGGFEEVCCRKVEAFKVINLVK